MTFKTEFVVCVDMIIKSCREVGREKHKPDDSTDEQGLGISGGNTHVQEVIELNI